MTPLRIVLSLLAFSTVAFAPQSRPVAVHPDAIPYSVFSSGGGSLDFSLDPFLHIMRTHFSYPNVALHNEAINFLALDDLQNQLKAANHETPFIVLTDQRQSNEMVMALPIEPPPSHLVQPEERVLALLRMWESSLEPGLRKVKVLGYRRISGVPDFEARLRDQPTFHWNDLSVGKVLNTHQVFDLLSRIRTLAQPVP